MSDDNNTQAIIDTAIASAEPTDLSAIAGPAAFLVPDGARVDVVDIEAKVAPYRPNPARKVGTFRVHDAASFVSYLGKHKRDESEVWADVQSAQIVGVVNAHDSAAAGAAGWGDHRVVYSVAQTDAWKAWLAHDGRLLDQSSFAEHIEERAVDIVRPSAAEMLELAQTFHATIGVRFESSKLLSSGERKLEYREQIDAKAGRAGSLEIPKDFELGLTPFEGAARYKVTARFRYRITDGALRVGYRLDRPADVVREAFLGVVAEIDGGTDVPVFRGVSA